MGTLINSITKSIRKETRTLRLFIKVRDWTTKPLKMMVEKSLTNIAMKGHYNDPSYKALNKEAKKKYTKRVLLQWTNTNKFTVKLEVPFLPDKTRKVSDWDMYWRERKYAFDLGLNLPIERKTNDLNNINLMYYNYMTEVVVPIRFDKSTYEEDKAKRLEALKKRMIEPAYAMEKLARLKGLADPSIKISIRITEKQGRKTVLLEETLLDYSAFAEDERPDVRVFDEQMKQHVFVKGKIIKRNNKEGVYDFDEELRPQKYFFSDWAKELVEADHRYNGDITQAIKDLKDYYYSRPEVMTYLMVQYDKGVFQNPHAEPVPFEKFIEIVKSYDEPIIEKYPLEDVLEGFTSSTSPENNKEANYA